MYIVHIVALSASVATCVSQVTMLFTSQKFKRPHDTATIETLLMHDTYLLSHPV